MALSDDRFRLARMHAQLLAGPPAAGVAGAVRGAAAIQAQDLDASLLAIRARTSGLVADDVRRAVGEERSVVRTWAMRGTLHMVPTADVGWIVDLLGPVFIPRFRRRRLELGLDDDLCERAVHAMAEILSGGRALTRSRLVAGLREAGVPVPPTGQAPAHVVLFAALRGVVCRGLDGEGGEPSYVLLREWAGHWEGRDEDAALAELARRHVSGYGPATPADFAAWSGLPARQARRGWEQITGELAEVATAAGPAWVSREAVDSLPKAAERFSAKLVGAFDGALLGHKRRDLMLEPEHARNVVPGGGIIHPAVLVDGRVVARWKWGRRSKKNAVVVEPFVPLVPELRFVLEEEVADIGRFLGTRTCLELVEEQ